MNSSLFQMVRVWAMLTGILLAGWFFGEISLGVEPSETVVMLAVATAGFELCLFAQDLWLKWTKERKGRGHG